ncbi:MAG: transposase [Deinococcus sp.]
MLTLLPDTRPREFILDRTFLGRTDAHVVQGSEGGLGPFLIRLCVLVPEVRTPARNWKYGQQDVNILLLAVIWRGVAIPLLFELLPHWGSSDTKLRHTLIDDALCLLSASRIQVLYADREFIGHEWIQGLAFKGIPICVRLRLDTVVDEWPARDWLQDLQPGNTGIWVEQVDVCGQPMNVTLTYTQDGEALIIASNAGSVTAIQTRYRKRFRIECLNRHSRRRGSSWKAPT